MLTLGIDLAAQAAKTAACRIAWTREGATVETLQLGADDAGILALAAGADAVGIDAPFGWPRPFVAFVRRHEAGRAGSPAWQAAHRDALRFRRTDVAARERLGRWPLSVSSDLIAIPALRCAGLLDRLGVRDRSGDGRVFEVYPALALHAWGLVSRGYKGTKNAAVLGGLLAALRERCPWLVLDPEQAARCAASDHAFDALVAALVARAAALGFTARPAPEETEDARIEGWIALPEPGSLERLAGGSSSPGG